MSDFGAGACDFHSDFASDFRPESNDFASDFGGGLRTAKHPPETPETAPPEQGKASDKSTGERERRQAGSASGKPRSRAQRHAIRPQTTGTEQAGRRRYRGIVPNIKTPYTRVKMANMAYSRKAPGIHREQKKTPHSLRHAGHGYFWSFARSSISKIGCNRIYNKIKGGTSLHRDCTTSAGAGQAKVNRRAVVVLV